MSDLVQVVEHLKSQVRAYRTRRDRLSEADTLRVLITPLLKALGWDIYDLDEVRNEYRHATADNPVDYALFLNRTPVLFVEAKALGESLSERKWMVQTINYANTSGVEWCVLTNGNEYQFYKVHAQVPVEQKLFLSLQLDDDADTASKARKLELLGRQFMGQRAIDALWTEWKVDRQVQSVLEGIAEDRDFLKLISKRIDGAKPSDVQASLRRAQFRIDYPGIRDVMDAAMPASQESERPAVSPIRPQQRPRPELAPDTMVLQPSGNKLIRTQEMFDRGLLAVGMKLTIGGRADTDACVVDGKTVEYKGENMSFNVWGCKATGWSAIQIYAHATLEDGRLLEELRQI